MVRPVQQAIRHWNRVLEHTLRLDVPQGEPHPDGQRYILDAIPV